MHIFPSTPEKNLLLHPSLSTSEQIPALDRIRKGMKVLRREHNSLRNTAVTFEHLGKLQPIRRTHLRDLASIWESIISNTPNNRSRIVIGLTESGLIPSFTMHRACLDLAQESQWFHSSRNDPSNFSFLEPHSHAPQHFLPGKLLASKANEVWIVEDEVTTGQTLLNLIGALRGHMNLEHCRIFCLLDMRTQRMRDDFCNALRALGISTRIDAVITASLDELNATDSLYGKKALSGLQTAAPTMIVPGERLVDVLPELMECDQMSIQHATRSPWAVDNVHILNRRKVTGNLFVYNVS